MSIATPRPLDDPSHLACLVFIPSMFELKPKNVGFLDTPTRVMNYAAVEKADDGGQLGSSNASS